MAYIFIDMRSKKHLSLSFKINFLIVGIILSLSAGLVYISYRIYSDRIDSIYIQQGERAADAAREMISPDAVGNLRDEILSDEFRSIRAEALAAGDENIIREWMRTRPSYIFHNARASGAADLPDDEIYNYLNLYTDYEDIIRRLNQTIQLFDIKVAYIQAGKNDKIINIADPEEDLFYLGTTEEVADIFKPYAETDYIPSIIYYSEYGWLCSTYLIMDETSTDPMPGYVGIDIDMNTIVRFQRMFLVNSALYVIAFTVLAILISMFLMNRTIGKPLLQLSRGTQTFAKDDSELTENDIIQLPITSNDEIGDLYHQIQSMQTRILDHIDNLNRITAEKERAAAELSMAKSIQKSMIPARFSAFSDRSEFDLYASMDPAREVGGDFYDFFMTDEDHLAVLIADVSDKGIPAALFMMSSMILISYRAHQGGTPAEILTEVNAHICRTNSSKMFVTVWMGIIDLDTGVMTCSNAGHEYPFIRSTEGQFKMFKDKHGLVIGALPKSIYKDYELKLEPGDTLFVYTDGVPEACNTAGEFYGMKRLEETLNRTAGENPRSILEAVKTDVDAFADDAKQFDDLTMLCLEYKGSPQK